MLSREAETSVSRGHRMANRGCLVWLGAVLRRQRDTISHLSDWQTPGSVSVKCWQGCGARRPLVVTG